LWPYRPSPGDIARHLEAYGVPVDVAVLDRLLDAASGAVPSLAGTTLV